MVKNLLAVQETWVQSLGQEDPLEKEMATPSSTLAWRIPRIDHGVAKSWTRLSHFHSLPHFFIIRIINSIFHLRQSFANFRGYQNHLDGFQDRWLGPTPRL